MFSQLKFLNRDNITEGESHEEQEEYEVSEVKKFLTLLLPLILLGTLKTKLDENTLETAYKVAICLRGNLLYKHIYFISDQMFL